MYEERTRIKEISLSKAIEFWNGKQVATEDVVATASDFENYLRNGATN